MAGEKPGMVSHSPPRANNARIDQLDILRGIAILGILIVNLPGAATYWVAFFGLEPVAGWTTLDRWAWAAVEVFVEGTQRGILQFLFGAAMLILTAKAMSPNGPVYVADIYYRRNMWLLIFGLANVFLLLFPGDILFVYALAALLLFPFRGLNAKTLLGLGLLFALYSTISGAVEYADRSGLQQRVVAAETKQAAGLELTAEDSAAVSSWRELEQRYKADPKELAEDKERRLGSFLQYAQYMHEIWIGRATLELFLEEVPEALATMLIGAALFKWHILQGLRSRRFYLLLGLAAYAAGVSLRIIEVQQHLTYSPEPRVVWFTDEIARLALTLGHVALISIVLSGPSGRRLLAPLKAAGRTAFSLYVLQTIITIWILFPGFGLGLFAQFGWAAMLAISMTIIAAQIALANLWLRYFSMGPVEWLWRSLVYVKFQPFRRPPARVAVLPA